MIKQANIFKAFIFILFVFFITGCESEEFFELKRPPQNPWPTVDEYELAVQGAYYRAFIYSSWESYYISDRVLNFVQSDLVHWMGNQEGYPMEEMLNRSTSDYVGQQTKAFTETYKLIGACNAALDYYYDNGEDPFPKASDIDKKDNIQRIVGELHLLRALGYFQNVRRHCPPYNPSGSNDDKILPYRITFPTSLDEASEPEYATTEKIYRLIINDIKLAKSFLPKEYKNTMHPSYQYGRANWYAASTLLGNVYFQMGKQDSALIEYNRVINSGKYSLAEEPLDNFDKMELGDDSPEVIWYMLWSDPARGDGYGPKKLTLFTKNHYPATGGGRGENWSLCPWNQFTLAKSAIAKTGWMADPLNGDYTETNAARYDKRYKQVFYRMEGASSDPQADKTKYITSEHNPVTNVDRPIIFCDKYFRSEIGMHQHVPIMRLADLYLKRAIIRFRAGDKEGAVNDINKIRKRAWDEVVAGAAYIPLTADQLTEEIIDGEWIKEMACEGNRLYYMMALQNPIGPGDRREDRPNQTLQPPYADYYWKIPRTEEIFRETTMDEGAAE
jgi:tetratricopeptide (TPR) repeat protein